MNQKNENDVENKELLFKEEVPDEELHSKLGVDDHIYVSNRRGIYGGPFLTFLALFLACSALFALMYGLISLSANPDRIIGVNVEEYRLKVIHSNNSYGGSINSFSKYNSSSKYYTYNFSIDNNNSIDLNYSVNLEIKEKSDNLDVEKINYTLLKNGIAVQSGNLSEFDSELYSTTALKGSSDEYQIRLWSNNLNYNSSLKFRIKILV